MKKFTPLALAAALATFSLFPIAVHAEEAGNKAAAGKAIYSANGQRIGAIYRVTQAGQVQLILEGHLVTVPNETISDNAGKLTTSLTKSELLKGK
jgi:hypothetical protein